MIIAFAATSASAQGPITGTPPFGSFGGGPDVINLANLNVHLVVPVLHKPGRGTNFDYDLTYDSSVWYPVTSGGTTTWQPVSGTWGWQGLAPAGTAYVIYTMTYTSSTCFNGGPVPYQEWSFNNFVYYDPLGVAHSFNYNPVYFQSPGGSNCPPNGPQPSSPQPQVASDGSGYTLYASPNSGYATAYMVASNGATIAPPVGPSPPGSQGSMSVTDRNGNQITSNNGVYTDTLGTTALTVAGTAPSNTTLKYTAPSGALAPYTVSYRTYTVKTNFGCSGISEYGATSSSLVDRVTLPDNSYYQFNYEGTPGYSGDVTGRIASVQLSTGGTITYGYTGGNNGIICADGSTSGLSRQTPDGTWTYARTMGTGAASATLITAPQLPYDSASNQTIVQFQGIYETQRDTYQGSAPAFSSLPIAESTLLTASLLQETQTCYTGNFPCTSTAVNTPLTFRGIINQLGSSGPQSKQTFHYNSFGSLTEKDDYDYGFSLLRVTLISYASLGNITAFRQTVTVQNGGLTTLAQTNYNYDETTPTATSGVAQHTSVSGSRGNLTSINYPVSGLTPHFTYYDTGSIKTVQDVNAATSTYNYSSNTASCQMAFPTSVTEPLSLSQSMTWNCTGGVQLTSTDENIKTTTTAYTDPYFWRPASVTDPSSATVSFCYGLLSSSTGTCTVNPTQVEFALNFNSNNSSVDSLMTVDGLGRTNIRQKRQSPTATSFDSAEADYDALGRPRRSTLAYSGTSGQTSSTAPDITTKYDALGRPLTVTDAGGGTTTYSYSNNDVLVTVGPAPSGEGTKRRQMEYDALGRLTSVCEITAGTAAWPSGTCAQNLSQTGYWTKYSYDALGDLLSVTQNAQATSANQQTRTYAFDAMSRLTSETNPESGTKNYVYDSDSTMCGNGTYTSKGDLLKTIDAAGNCVMRYYDALHRLTDVGDVSRCLRFRYDNTNGVLGSKPSGVSVSNTLARLAEAETDTCASPITQSSIITDEWFSYTARGEQSDVYESTPHSSGYYHISAQYWASGALSQLGNNIAGLPAFTYGVDGEGRINTVSANSGQNPVTGVTYNNSSLPTQVTFGSADTDIFAYDANTMRMTQYQFNINGQSSTGALTWNANSSLQQLSITDAFNNADNQTCNYGYDDIVRLASANCGAAAAQTFTYDPFGNINKSGSPNSFQPTYSPTTNRMTSLPGNFTPTYDANGNVTNDSNHTYSWDADGNSIAIDSVGLTVEKNVSGSYTQIVYAPSGDKLALMNGQTLQNAFVHLPGRATAVYTGNVLDHYRHSDWLGSARLGSSPTRTVVSTTAYAPFGESYAQSGTPDLSFTGQNPDTVSGDYDFQFREYSTEGRWPSPDPAGLGAVNPMNPQSWNRYAYVLNNPLGFVDPLGLYCQWDDGTSDGIGDSPEGSSPQACSDAGGRWIPDLVPGSTFAGTPSGEQVCTSIGGVSSCASQNYGPSTDAIYNPSNAGLSIWDFFTVPWSGTVLLPLVPFGPAASAGVGPTVAYNPKTDTGCYGLAAGAMVPAGGRAVAAGPLTVGNLDNTDNILAGGSVFAGAQSPNPAVGVQVTGNSSGLLAGATFGSMGATAGASYSKCQSGVGKKILSWAIDNLLP
jgi:RHS repeat-associated protein